MKTFILVEITHKKPLPDKTPITDVVADRLYNYCFSQGVEVGTTAQLLGDVDILRLSVKEAQS